jgi:hypothetical protein
MKKDQDLTEFDFIDALGIHDEPDDVLVIGDMKKDFKELLMNMTMIFKLASLLSRQIF